MIRIFIDFQVTFFLFDVEDVLDAVDRILLEVVVGLLCYGIHYDLLLFRLLLLEGHLAAVLLFIREHGPKLGFDNLLSVLQLLRHYILTGVDIAAHKVDEDLFIDDAQVIATQRVGEVLELHRDHLLLCLLTAIDDSLDDFTEVLHDDVGAGAHDALVLVLHHVIVVLEDGL